MRARPLVSVLVGALIGAALRPGLALPAGVLFQHPADPAGQQQPVQMLQLAVRAVLDNRGAPNTLVPASAATTAGSSAATLATSQGTATFDWAGDLAIDFGNVRTNPATYDPRVLLHGSTWPSKPHVWFFYPAAGCNTAGNTGTDTTGTNDCYPTPTPNGSLYAVGMPYAWKNLSLQVKAAVATTPRAAGYWRAVLAYGDTPAGGGPNPWAVKDADSLARSVDPDSVVVWVRERYPGDPAAQVFCYGSIGSYPNIPAIKCALATLDAITARTVPGGAVFTNRSLTCRPHGVAIARGNGTGDPRSANLFNSGTYCPSADSCDLANQAAGRDSLRSWLGGASLTVLLDPDSLDSPVAAQLVAGYLAMPGVKFGLQPVSGWSSTSTTRAGAPGRCVDPIGISRRRTMFGATPALAPDCSADSGSIACNLAAGWDALAAKVGRDRLDHVLVPALWDWTPQEWTRAGLGVVNSGAGGRLWGGIDSLVAALWAGRCRAVLCSPTAAQANVGISWTNVDGAVASYATAPAGLTPANLRLPVRWGGATVGSVALMSARWEPSAPAWSWAEGSHPVGDDFITGDEMGKYYLVDAAPYYRHTFNVRTRVLVVQGGNVGGPWGDRQPQFPAARVIKWVQQSFQAANAMLPAWADGTPKRLDCWAPIEELEP